MKKSAVTLIPGPSNDPPDNLNSMSPKPCHPSRLCHPLYLYPALLTYMPLADFLLELFQNSFYFSYILYSILLPFLNRLTSVHLPSSLSLPLLNSPQDSCSTFFMGLPVSCHPLSHSLSELEVEKLIFQYRFIVILPETSRFPTYYWIKKRSFACP